MCTLLATEQCMRMNTEILYLTAHFELSLIALGMHVATHTAQRVLLVQMKVIRIHASKEACEHVTCKHASSF